MIQKLFNLVVKGQGHGDIMSVIKLVDTLQICIPCNLIQLLTFVEVNIRILSLQFPQRLILIVPEEHLKRYINVT
jgi:hypothetical protein